MCGGEHPIPRSSTTIDVWAIASARGEGTVSARSRSERDRARVARAKGGRPAREVREDTARQAEDSGATIEANVAIRGWFVRPKVTQPTRGALVRPATPRIVAPIGSRKRARRRTCALFRLRHELPLVGRALMHLQNVA